MNKLDVLFIRACKSEDPVVRLRSLYRRFYYSGGVSESHQNEVFVCILSRIIESANIKVPLDQAILCKDPLHFTINLLRFYPVSELPNYISATRFRRKS